MSADWQAQKVIIRGPELYNPGSVGSKTLQPCGGENEYCGSFAEGYDKGICGTWAQKSNTCCYVGAVRTSNSGDLEEGIFSCQIIPGIKDTSFDALGTTPFDVVRGLCPIGSYDVSKLPGFTSCCYRDVPVELIWSDPPDPKEGGTRERVFGIRCGDWQIPAGTLPLPSSGEDPVAATTTSIDEGPATTEPPETTIQASKGYIGEDGVTRYCGLSSYLCAASLSYGCCKDGYECGTLSCTLRGGPDFTSQPDKTARNTSDLISTVGITSKSISTSSGNTTPVSVSTLEPTTADATSTSSNNEANGVTSSVSSSSQSATSTRATGPAATPKVSLLILASVVLLTSIGVQL